jgi:glutamate carboxypeptidase
LSGHDELVSVLNPRGIAGDLDLIRPAPRRLDQRTLDAAKVPKADVAYDDPHVRHISYLRQMALADPVLRCLRMTPPVQDATSWLADQQQAMEDAIARLVEINSYTDNPEGGRKVGALLRDLFRIPGLDVSVRTSERFADHLVFRSRPNQPNRTALALVGHLDTVFPPGTFEGYRRDGSLACGPGVLDMKGGLVVIAFAVQAIAATVGLDAVAPLRIVIVSDEEVGSPEGHGVIAAAIAGSSGCLVFEAGRAADGRAAHAGNGHREGINAIWAMARFIDKVQDLTQYDRGVTVNVGRVTGGLGANTVPDRAEALVDLRFRTRADGERLVAAMHAASDAAAASVKGCRLELSGGILRAPLERTEDSLRLFSEYAACARAHGLGHAEAPLIGGASDASTASAIGIPAIDGLGPRGSGFHTKDERIDVDSLIPKAQALAQFIVQRAPA